MKRRTAKRAAETIVVILVGTIMAVAFTGAVSMIIDATCVGC